MQVATDSRQPVIVSEVSRHFGKLTAVENVSLDVSTGTILGVIGPSGSGKTTLIRMLTGTLDPSAGRLRVLGEEPRRFRRQTREQIGYMPQQFALYPDLTAAENVDFVAAMFGLIWRRRHRRVREVLEFVELWDARARPAKNLSGGMQRRLELACALVHQPILLFVDEPTAGLDPVLRQTIWTEFRRLRDAGRTLVVTTQYVGEAEYCDRVAILAEGRLIAHDTPEMLRRRAVGGEVIEIVTERAIDASLLNDLPSVRNVQQTGPRKILIVTEDAGQATPRVLEAIADQGVAVASSSEYRPSFDEVFTELIDHQTNGTGSDHAAGAA